MGKKLLLDCTLRDGGYVNDWNFGHNNLVNVFERVTGAGIDAIEIGFLDERRPFDMNRSIMPDVADVEKIYGKLDRKKTMVVGMIDYGTCGFEHLCPASESWLDGIRVIFKKDKAVEAMNFCRKVKALGYRVFSQLVSVTSYTDEELIEVLHLVNEVHPFAVSMVDTYGLLNPTSLSHLIQVIDQNLDPDICLGFHAHNNFQLGFINAVTLLDSNLDRDVLVDGSLYGMGKSAGNAPLELIAMYMNDNCGKHYDVNALQEAIVTSILDIYSRNPWGYKLFFYIAAKNRCHPNYVSYLMNKRTLSVSAMNEILQMIPEEEKLGKNMKMLEQLYLTYMKNECDDTAVTEKLKGELLDRHPGRKILVLGPAASIRLQKEKISDFIQENQPLIFSVNYIPEDFRPAYIFITNASRYLQMETGLHDEENQDIRLIATSNLTKSGGSFEYVLNFSSLIDEKAEFPDNSLIMFLRFLIRIGAGEVYLAGFDGYTPNDVNYFEQSMEYSFVKDKADSLNRYASDFIERHRKDLRVHFVTDSHYCQEKIR